MTTGSEEAELASGAGVESLVPGCVWQLVEMAEVLRGHSVVLQQAGDALSRVEVTHWRGEASGGFQSVIEVQPGRWSGAAAAFDDAAKAIDGYAVSLGPAREVAAQAVQLYRDYLAAAAALCAVTTDRVGNPSPGGVPTPGAGLVAVGVPQRMMVGYRAQRLRDATDGVAAAGGVLAAAPAAAQGLVQGAEALRREAIAALVRARRVVQESGDLAADAVARAMEQAPAARRFYQPTIRPAGAEEAAHGVLDLAGMVPGVVGVAANSANAGWYLAEGRGAEAGLAVAGMVPLGRVLKEATKTTRLAEDGAKVIDGAAGTAAIAAPEVQAASDIAKGHAWSKHVLQQGEFPEVSSREEFAALIEDVMTTGESKQGLNGRTFYWKDRTFVVRNPHDADGGTAFRPADGRAYYERQDVDPG